MSALETVNCITVIETGRYILVLKNLIPNFTFKEDVAINQLWYLLYTAEHYPYLLDLEYLNIRNTKK